MKRLGLGFIVFLALLASLQQNAHAQTLRERLQQRATKTESSNNKPIIAPGDYRFSIQSGGRERHYLVHVPRSYDAAHPAPLLMALHGGGGNMDFQADDSHYGLITASEKHGFIAVFPNGVGFMGDKLATWNAGNCCGKARDENVGDVDFLRAVVAEVEGKLAIDKARVYATGMSNGGMMAQRLGCEAADMFAAIAPVAGSDNTSECKPARPIAVIEFHALDDDHVLFKGGAGEKAFPNRKQVTDFTPVPETISRWTRRNQCSSAAAKTVLEVPGAHCEVHEDCKGGASVQLCTTDTGGHSWPGAGTVRAGKAAASQAISANELMWDFFSRHPAPTPQ